MGTVTQFADITIQTPTIHRLDLELIPSTSTSKTKLDETKITNLLKRIKDLHNAQLDTNTPKCYRFKELTLNDRLCKGINNCQFRIWCVWRKISYDSTPLTPLLKALGVGDVYSPSSTSTETVFFFYRLNKHGQDDVFALTEGTFAWKLFAKYRDSFFARILTRQLVTSHILNLKTRPLFGDKTQTESKHDGKHFVQETKHGFTWIERLKARMKEEACPETIPRLRQNPPSLTMQEKAITLHTSLKLEEWFLFLNHLSELYYNTKENPNDAESVEFAFLTSLQPAPTSNISALEKTLCLEIWRIFSAKGQVETALRFIPRHNDEYDQADTYSFSHIDKKSSKGKCWSSRLSTADLIRQLVTCPSLQGFVTNLKKHNPQDQLKKLSEEFVKQIAKVRVYYSKEKKKCHSSLLTKGLDGEIILSTGEHFFHVKGEWMQPRLDFFAGLHHDFMERLKLSLIKEGHPHIHGHLPNHWKGRQSSSNNSRQDVEGEYNLSYVGQPGYVVGDKACPHGIEIFDILFHDEPHDTLYLYQVKEKFSGGARAAAFQLMSAADAIFATRNGDNTWLEVFADQLKSHNPPAHKEFIKWGGLKKLRQLIKKTPAKNIVFVYAIAIGSVKQKDLEDELQLIQAFNDEEFTNMAKLLTKAKFSSKFVREMLFSGKFIDESGRLTAAGLTCFEKGGKARFIKMTTKHMDEANALILYERLKSLAGTKFNSSIPRFSIIKAARHIENRGFTFAIDQITHKDNSLPLTDALGSVLLIPTLPTCDTQDWAPGSIFTVEEEDYCLQSTLDEGIAPLHAVLGDWNESEQAYCWKINQSREKFVKKIRKKLASEKKNKEKGMDEAIRSAIQQLINYRIPTKGQPLPDNAQSFWKQVDGSKIMPKLKEYIKQRRACEKKYPNHNQSIDKEINLLKKCLDNFGGNFIGKAATHPNTFVQCLSAKKGKLNQSSRITQLETYKKDPKKLKSDYKKNRPAISNYISGRSSTIDEEKELKEIYQGENQRKECEDLLEKLNPIELYLNSLLGDRVYGLEEAQVAAYLAPNTVHIYTPHPKNIKKVKQLGGNFEIEESDRLVFMSIYKTQHQFFACCRSGEAHSIVDSKLTLDDSANDTDDSTDEDKPPPTHLPLWMKLRNIGNSCYLDSALQALLASDTIGKQIQAKKPTKQNEAIFKPLLNLLKGKENNQEKLKKAIFKSKLHPEFNKDTFHQQLDAASVIELLSEQFLSPLPLLVYKTVSSLYGLVFEAPSNTKAFILQVPITSLDNLQDAVNQSFIENKNDPDNKWKCNPSEGTRIKREGKSLIDKTTEATLKQIPVFDTSQYDDCLELKEMPDALVVHLKRFFSFGGQPIKLNNDVNLPTDGILYLTHNSAVTAKQYSKETGLKGRYRIKSYIVHKDKGENIGGGHYKTYLEHKNEYYRCDDLKEAPKPISKEDFLSRRDAYLIVLEKIKDTEVK